MKVQLQDKILSEYEIKKVLHDECCLKVESLLKDVLKEHEINIHSINSRVKEEKSLSSKIKKGNGKYNSLEDITDVSGIRIITYFSQDVDKVADIIQSEFEIDRDNSVDKRLKLDADRFGYLSLHYVISLSDERVKFFEYKRFKGLKLEVQIRSILQHAWAEIEHDLGYKSKKAIPEVVRRDFSRLAGLLEIADEEFVKIREKLIQYNKTVKEEIKNKPSSVFIDSISIEQLLIDSDSIAHILDKKIVSLAKGEIIPLNNEMLEKHVHRLKYLNFNTVDELIISLNQNQEIIMKFANEWLTDIYDSIYAGLSLYYLPFAILGKKGSYNELLGFLNQSLGIAGSNDNLATEIIEICKKN